ncbi:hypothetical protein SGLAM104S_06177 [Streptomyces glaucescens]
MMRGGSIKAGPAIVAILFGFFLASSGMAPSINRFLNSIAETINSSQLSEPEPTRTGGRARETRQGRPET